MDTVRKDVRRLVNKELEAANKRFPQFASPHEGQNVVREELEEAERAQTRLCRKTISRPFGKPQ